MADLILPCMVALHGGLTTNQTNYFIFLMRGENCSNQIKTSQSIEEYQQALLTSCAESEIKTRPHSWKAKKAINFLE